MEFKKCNICGNFFISTDTICGNCRAKEMVETSKLKNYIENYDGDMPSMTTLVEETGIPEKSISRYLQSNNFTTEPKITL